MLRNSTRQPIGEFGGGGLKRKVCQFVDWMFCKFGQIMMYQHSLDTNYLKVITTCSVILVDGLGKYNERIANKQMGDMFGQ
jgi:hypothetical protein